jgi:hypothetical protein
MSLDPNYLLVALLVSSIGFVLFVYGKRQRRPPQLGGGLILLVYPYFVHNPAWMVIIAVAVIAAVWAGIRLGY